MAGEEEAWEPGCVFVCGCSLMQHVSSINIRQKNNIRKINLSVLSGGQTFSLAFLHCSYLVKNVQFAKFGQ